MNIDLKDSFNQAKTSLCSRALDVKQTRLIKIFAIGIVMCMNGNAAAEIVTLKNSYPVDARTLIVSNVEPANESWAQDIHSIREQLAEKTKELETYKANLFRPSLPQDQEKITELCQRIIEQEKTKRELASKVTEFEIELMNTKKQMKSFEISTQALTDFIQNQQTIAEAEKQELLFRIHAFEEDQSLEDEKRLNAKLNVDLATLKDAVASYENQIIALEQNYEKELQDSLKDAAMLKFELADARLEAKEKEQELLVSTLNYLAMALDHVKIVKAKELAHKAKLYESQQDLSALQLLIDELNSENSHLQKENIQLTDLNNSSQDLLDQLLAEKHILATQLVEQEKALTSALLYYQGMIAQETLRIKVQQDRNELQNAHDQQTLDNQMVDYLKQEIENLRSKGDEKLAREKELERAVHSLTIVAEHQDHALAEANSTFSMLQEYNHSLEIENETLKNQLHTVETAGRQVNTRSHTNQNQTLISPTLFHLLKPK